MCNQDIPAPTTGKLTALNAKGWASEGKPIQAQLDCNQSCPLYSVSSALTYQLEGVTDYMHTHTISVYYTPYIVVHVCMYALDRIRHTQRGTSLIQRGGLNLRQYMVSEVL